MYFLNKERLKYKPKLPEALIEIDALTVKTSPLSEKLSDDVLEFFLHSSKAEPVRFERGSAKKAGPLTIGVVFSGGQAPGGHNVVAGIFDAIKKFNPKSKLIGFLGGPDGIIKNRSRELFEEDIAQVRNQGGFDLLGSGRTKIEKPEDFENALKTCVDGNLDGLIIIGGDDSNTNAAMLAEYFLGNGCKTCVAGVPKTIDGDLKSALVEASFGFDTASKTFSTAIGSLLRDALSAKKYTFFIKLMGRTASHIALECALETHPNLTLIGEEIAQDGLTLNDVVKMVADAITLRASIGKNYGAVLIPEGFIEFIAEFKTLIQSLNEILAKNPSNIDAALDQLPYAAKALFNKLPELIRAQLLEERDPHGNVQVSKIESERLLMELVAKELSIREKKGEFKGKFSPVPIFLGYEGRSCLPSNFDANYCYALGQTAALLLKSGLTGYMACVKNLSDVPEKWQLLGTPLFSMMTMEKRKGVLRAVIKKALVDLNGQPFLHFREHREGWVVDDDYHYPGPIQFYGPSEISDQITLTLKLESQKTTYVM